MRIRIILAILATTTLGSTADADFVITNPPPAADPPVVPDPQPRAPAYPVHPTPTRFKIAHGFGRQVPLSFAVRQIVPPAIKVAYRPGADPNAAGRPDLEPRPVRGSKAAWTPARHHRYESRDSKITPFAD